MKLKTRNIPQGATKVCSKFSDAVAYLYTEERHGRLCAKIYYGKQSKPVGNFHYRDAAEREKSIARYFDGRAAWQKTLNERAAERKVATRGVEVGTILCASWGYDQTNVDFYKILRLVGGKSVEVVKIGSKMTGKNSGNSMAGYCVADPEKIVGEPMLRRAMNGGVRIDECCTARVWDQKEEYVSWYA